MLAETFCSAKNSIQSVNDVVTKPMYASGIQGSDAAVSGMAASASRCGRPTLGGAKRNLPEFP